MGCNQGGACAQAESVLSIGVALSISVALSVVVVLSVAADLSVLSILQWLLALLCIYVVGCNCHMLSLSVFTLAIVIGFLFSLVCLRSLV